MAKKKRVTKVLLRKTERKQIREFSKFIPSLEKYVGKDKIESHAYAAFKRAKKKLRHTDTLKPVTAKQAKLLKGKLAGGGIRAIRLRETSPNAKVRVRKGGIVVTSNGRDWEYHPVKSKNADSLPEAMIKAGHRLFSRKKNPPWQLHIWTSRGRSNEGQGSYEKWVPFVIKFFQQYQNSGDFVFGIAALIKDSDGKVRPPIPKEQLQDVEDDQEEDEEDEG